MAILWAKMWTYNKIVKDQNYLLVVLIVISLYGIGQCLLKIFILSKNNDEKRERISKSERWKVLVRNVSNQFYQFFFLYLKIGIRIRKLWQKKKDKIDNILHWKKKNFSTISIVTIIIFRKYSTF